MNIFTDCFKQLSTKKGKTAESSLASSNSNNLKEKETSTAKNMSTTSESLFHNESTVADATNVSDKNVKEGKSFKYNEVGRRYHGNEEVAYLLPNDDDGNMSIILNYKNE
jgi:hypothetical protein